MRCYIYTADVQKTNEGEKTSVCKECKEGLKELDNMSAVEIFTR